jgi:hypothetical protein
LPDIAPVETFVSLVAGSTLCVGMTYCYRHNMVGKEKKSKIIGLKNIVDMVEKLGRACAAILDKAWR